MALRQMSLFERLVPRSFWIRAPMSRGGVGGGEHKHAPGCHFSPSRIVGHWSLPFLTRTKSFPKLIPIRCNGVIDQLFQG